MKRGFRTTAKGIAQAENYLMVMGVETDNLDSTTMLHVANKIYYERSEEYKDDLKKGVDRWQ